MFMLTPKQTSWVMQGATVATLIFMLATYKRVPWSTTKLIMIGLCVLASVMFIYTLAHYIAEELWLRKLARGKAELEIDGNAP